jgi:hypothetical protein
MQYQNSQRILCNNSETLETIGDIKTINEIIVSFEKLS